MLTTHSRGRGFLAGFCALGLVLSACGTGTTVESISDADVNPGTVSTTATPLPRRTLPPAPTLNAEQSAAQVDGEQTTPTATPTRATDAAPTVTPPPPTPEPEPTAQLASTDVEPTPEPTEAPPPEPTPEPAAAPAPTEAPAPPPPTATTTATSTPEPTPTSVEMVCPTGYDRQSDGRCKGIVNPKVNAWICPGGYYPEAGGTVKKNSVCIDGLGLFADPEPESYSCPAGSERWLVGNTCIGFADPVPASE